MKMTLLDMVQNILSAMESDEVNSIADTVESLQVAEVVRETYFEQIAGLNLPSNKALIQLQGLGDVTRPNYLTLPDNVRDIEWFKYDMRTGGVTAYANVTYLTPEDFLSVVIARQLADNTTEVEDASGVRYNILTNANPTYWTTFDNQTVACDAVNLALESTLQTHKTLCNGYVIPSFQLTDSFIPNLDADRFPQLLAEAKAVCFINFKGVANSKEEQRSRRGLVRNQSNIWRMNQRKPYDSPWIAGRGRGSRASTRTP